MNWDDINLKDYEELQNLYKTDKTRFSTNAIEYLFSVKNADVTLPMTEYLRYLNEIQFFQTQPPTAKLKLKYNINSTVYKVNTDIQAFSAVQFQDFTTYSKMENCSMIDLLSVVLIPEGHRYNDGYDLEQVKTDIGTMAVADALSVCFFFASWLKHYVRILSGYLTKKKLMKKLPTEVQTKVNLMVQNLQAAVTE